MTTDKWYDDEMWVNCLGQRACDFARATGQEDPVRVALIMWWSACDLHFSAAAIRYSQGLRNSQSPRSNSETEQA
jgi:hypothetical protein